MIKNKRKSIQGKQVFYLFVSRNTFETSKEFEIYIKSQASRLKNSQHLYKLSKSGRGIVKIHRNKHGAIIFAYDYKK